MWVRATWFDPQGTVLRTDGEYGPLGVNVGGNVEVVETLLDLHDPNTVVFEAKPGMTREWAGALLSLGYSPSIPLRYDRLTGAVTGTLGDLASSPAGTRWATFRFALNDYLVIDNRIPPWGMDRDEALARSIEPVPAGQYGDPGPGGVYEHWADVGLHPPQGAVRATLELLYQPTSWEYVQFLLLANDGSTSFLAATGQDLFDAWSGTGMAAPHVMASVEWNSLQGSGEDLVLQGSVNGTAVAVSGYVPATQGDAVTFTLSSPGGTFEQALAVLAGEIFREEDPPVSGGLLPLVHLDAAAALLAVGPLPSAGHAFSATVPVSLPGWRFRFQGVVLTPAAANGSHATSAAIDVGLH